MRDLVDHRGAVGRPKPGERLQARLAEERGTTATTRERDAEEHVAIGNRGLARPDHVRAVHAEGGRAGTPGQHERANEPESDTYRHRRCCIRERGF
jgi:hypothetical protein